MEKQSSSTVQNRIWFISLILAPLLLFISQFFWVNGVLNITSGWIQVLAFVFWIPAFQAMFSLVKDKMPGYAAVGFLIAIYACIAGNNFGIDGIYGEAIGITGTEAKAELHQKLGIGGLVALYIPGLLFPLSLILLGINLIRTRSVELWVGILLIIAAVGFPISRIPREPIIAHLDNLLLLVSHTLIALRIRKE
jgi:hypothetical protein